MSSTSKKHVNFVSEPMKKVRRFPDSVISGNMKREGIAYAYEVFGKFLVLSEWLKQFTANSKHRNDC